MGVVAPAPFVPVSLTFALVQNSPVTSTSVQKSALSWFGLFGRRVFGSRPECRSHKTGTGFLPGPVRQSDDGERLVVLD
jgi:hypothetical protein